MSAGNAAGQGERACEQDGQGVPSARPHAARRSSGPNRSLVLALVAALVTLACASGARAQEREPICAVSGRVTACIEDPGSASPQTLAELVNADVGEGASTLRVTVSVVSDVAAISVRAERAPLLLAHVELTTHEPRERSAEIAHEIHLGLHRASAGERTPSPPARTDERPDPGDADPTWRWYPTVVFTAPPAQGTWMLTTRIRVMPSSDRQGVALGGDVSLEHMVADHFLLGVSVTPYAMVGQRVMGGRTGIAAALHARVETDLGALGIYGGVATLARSGGPLAGLFGLSLRLGAYDLIHGILYGSFLWNDTYGVLFGQGGVEMLLPLDVQWGIVIRGEAAPELGWAHAEAGLQFFFLDESEPRAWGLELAGGAQWMQFHESCGFGPCPNADSTYGPMISLGLFYRAR